MEDHLEVMHEILDKTRQLRGDVEALHNSNASQLLIRLSRDAVVKLKDAFTCAICKGKII
jgi:hypothetical protein